MRVVWFFFFQAEDGIRDLVRSRGLGDVYKRQVLGTTVPGGGTRSLADLWADLGRTIYFSSKANENLSLIHI